ncbi:MAG: hypothetical protein HW389_2614 [Bacteroidetes bacterium]|nr:hypothetical protein [Bacteroidota bacterium]
MPRTFVIDIKDTDSAVAGGCNTLEDELAVPKSVKWDRVGQRMQLASVRFYRRGVFAATGYDAQGYCDDEREDVPNLVLKNIRYEISLPILARERRFAI